MNSTVDKVQSDTDGFGIAEVLVAMLLLMIVAVTMLPMFISAMRLASENVSLATANQMVSSQLDLARSLATCEQVKSWAAETVGLDEHDPRKVILVVHRESSGACATNASNYPTALPVKVWVTVQGTSKKIAEAETRVHVDSWKTAP